MAYKKNKKNKENNKDYVDKVVPNSDGGKLLVVHYNPSDGDHESWLTVAGECAKNDQKRALQLISVARGDTADQIYALLTGKTAK